MGERGEPLPEFDAWDSTYIPVFEGLQKPVNDLQGALGAFDNGAIALGEEAMSIAAEIEAFHLRTLEELGLLDLWRDSVAPRTPQEWLPYAQQVLERAVIGLDPADLTGAVVISSIDSPSMIIVSHPEPGPAPIAVHSERLDESSAEEDGRHAAPEPVDPPTGPIKMQSERPDEASLARLTTAEFIEKLDREREVVDGTAFHMYTDMLIDVASPPPPPFLDFGARESLEGVITAQTIREGVARIPAESASSSAHATVTDTGTPTLPEKPSPVSRRRGRRRRSHEAAEECTGTGLCKTGCIVQPPQAAEEPPVVELPPIPPHLIPELSDAEMDTLLDVPIKFWVCPDEEHHDLRDDQGEKLPTVAWEGEVARCLTPGCEHTNAEGSATA